MRVDRQAPVRLGATPVRTTPDGFKVYRGTATFGDVVLDYPDLSPPRSEFVPASEALSPEAVASLLNMPFSIEHPPDLLTPETAREHVVGTVILAEADLAARPPALLVEVMVYDAGAQEDIESGRMCELSPGYRCEEDVLLGSHGGKRYQVVQRRRRYNHLSGVASARSVTADGRRARLDEAPDRAAYPPRDMADTETNPVTPKTRADALSPEDAEIMKTMSPEAQAVIAAALGGGMASSEASGAGVGAEPNAGNGGADINKMMADMLKALQAMPALIIEAVKGGAGSAPATAEGGDAAPPKVAPGGAAEGGDAPPPTDRKDGAAQAQALDSEAIIRQAREETARVTDARIEVHARMVGAVRRDGHADVDTVADAAKVMLVTVGNHLPDLKSMAEGHLKAGRMDELAVLYKQAENVRRDGLLDTQGRAVSAALASAPSETNGAPVLAPTWRPPTLRGA